MGKKVRLKTPKRLQSKSLFGSKITKFKHSKANKSKQTSTKEKLVPPKIQEKEELYSLRMDNNYAVDDDCDALETQYEDEKSKETVNIHSKLPIKTKSGIVPIVEVIEPKETDLIEFEEDESSEEEEEEKPILKTISATELLIMQNKTLQEKRIQIGSLSASILENPDDKMHNFKALYDLLKADEVANYVTIKKVIVVSLLEIFKDLLPSYQIKPNVDTSVKLKKDTLNLHKHETLLLQYYKKFLQILEQMSLALIKRRAYSSTPIQKKMGELAVGAFCELLTTHPYFNYSENIAQSVIHFLNHPKPSIREKVYSACKSIFLEDTKGQISLKIVLLINQCIKKFSFNIQPDLIKVLLHLKIKNVNMDEEKSTKIKQKKLQSHKGNILKLSKKEKKRKSRLKEVEKALLEAKAEESKQNKNRHQTEIIKLIFGIYFRILKSSTNTNVVGICLQGISKFAHCINIEFYVDLIKILDALLKAEWLHYTDQQLCIQTIFAILSEQGEVLNLDPIKFYANIYDNLLRIDASRTSKDFHIVLETLVISLIKRHKKVSHKRMAGFLKRISTLSLQLLHNGTISCLSLIKSILQFNSAMDVLLDLESSPGDGKYLPELSDPEYCNAYSTGLYELTLLNRHYNPSICKYAKYVASGAPITSENNLPHEWGRASPMELYNTFDMAQMCFYPPISIQKFKAKARLNTKSFCDDNFRKKCFQAVKDTRCILV